MPGLGARDYVIALSLCTEPPGAGAMPVHNRKLRKTFFMAQTGRPTRAAVFKAAQVPNPPHKGAQEVHRWIFVRENLRGSKMDMSAAEVKRAAVVDGLAQPASSSQTSPSSDPNGSEILVRCLQAEGVKYLWGYPGGAVLYIFDAVLLVQRVVDVQHRTAGVTPEVLDPFGLQAANEDLRAIGLSGM